MSGTTATFDGWSTQSAFDHSLIDPLCSEVPSSTYSPESSYSAASPECRSPTSSTHQAFEFDNSHEEIQAEEYDELMDQVDDVEGEGEMWNRPGWGNLRNYGGRRPSWALSNGGGSIISMSPRGSLSSLGGGSLAGSIDSRRASIPKAPKLPYESRRSSNPSLLGFDLSEQRRRSSIARNMLSRRRSSGLSSTFRSNSFSQQPNPNRNGSTIGMGIRIFDSIEETRLKNIASLELLKRRFSEVVQVNNNDNESDEEENLDDAWAHQDWSPYSGSYYSEDEDDSEIHTDSYTPSHGSRNNSTFGPFSFSNFPLESVAVAPDAIPNGSQSELSSIGPSPLLQDSRFTQTTTTQFIGTPPAVSQPYVILRDRNRPTLNRSETAFAIPRSIGVPPGAAPPRPGLARSVSNPLICSTTACKEAIKAIEVRASGSFPLARAIPLGISPLRESLRRQSIVSEGEGSRRSSLGDRRRSSFIPQLSNSRRNTRNESIVSENEFNRKSSLGERKLSLVKESALRRMSGDTRRSSKGTSSNSRKSSTIDSASGVSNKRPSTGSIRRSSSLKEVNLNSRHSSVVSVGEYGYLAPQIVIEVPKIAVTSQAQSVLLPKETQVEPPRLRANAPPLIILPSYTFPLSTGPSTSSTMTPMSTSSTSSTPRYNPLSYFLHTSSSTPSTSYDPLETPTTAKAFFPYTSPISNESPKTPKLVNVIDRGRPISSPEFDSAVLPFKSVQPPSPKSSPGMTLPLPSLSEIGPDDKVNEESEDQFSGSGESKKEISRIKSVESFRKTISIEDMHLVLANVIEKEKSVEVGDNTPIATTRPVINRQSTIIEEPKSKITRPNLFRGTSVPLLPNTISSITKQNYSFPSKSIVNSSYPISSSTPSSPLGPGKKSTNYQFPSSPPTEEINQIDIKGKGKLLSPEPELEQRPQLVKRRSITFIEPPSPRNSKFKMDRTSSFTKFMKSSINKAKLSTSGSSSSSSSSSSSFPASKK